MTQTHVKTSDIKAKVLWSIEQSIKVRVHSKIYCKSPTVGKFVILPGDDAINSKNLFRFVSDSNEDNFECAADVLKENFTRVYALDTILLIKPI